MIESVVGLLMFINGEIKEPVYKTIWHMSSCKTCSRKKYSESVSYKCWKGKAETEVYMGEKSIKKIILSE